MTLPAGQPVVSGTAISSTTFNDLVADLAAMIEDSLSRSGDGGMQVPLEFSDGTSAAPAITFTNDTNTGLYRSNADTIGVVTGGAERILVNNSGTVVYEPLEVQGNFTVSGAYTVTLPPASLSKAALAAVGQQVSTASGTKTFTGAGSDSYADVPNLSVTITTLGRPVMLMIQPDGANAASLYAISAGALQLGSLIFARGASTIGEFNSAVSTGVEILPFSPPFMLDVTVAGTYTYKVQGKVNNTAASLIVNNWKLVAYEL